MDDEDDYEYRQGERCSIDGCRSRRYRTNEQGYEECSNGHQHGLARGNIDDDEDEFWGTLRGKRFRKEGAERVKVFKHLRGKDAFELYLLCYQLVLRRQVWWLVREKGLPKELEVIVHDLWALRVQNLRSRVNSEDQPGSEAEIDTDVDILFDSQDVESDGEAGTTNLVTSSGRARATKTASPPSLQQSLALSYMATQFLRLPIFLGDILMWAKSGSLLYHDASAQIPREMYQRLPSTYQKQFRPQIHLTNGQVLHSVTKLVLMYNKDFGLVLPSLNLPVHLFRMVEELALPLEVYSAARRLAAFMKFDFSYPNVTNDCITIIDLPEAQVVACIIVVLKLFYGFDDIKRIPTAETSPGAAIIDWHEWARIMRDSAPLDDQEAMQMTDREIIDLPDGKVDDYLDFFQEHFTVEDPQDKDKDADFRKMIMGLFPVGSRSTKKRDVQDYVSTLKQENVQVMQASLKPNKVIFEMDEMDLEDKDKAIIRPGESYQKHRNAYELTGHAKAFYIVVSQISGLPVKSICRALVHAEMRLKHLRKGKIPRGRQPKRHHKSKYRLNTEELASDIVGSEFGDELRSEMDMRSEKGDYDLHIGMDDGEREVNSEMGEL